jgi:2-methylcitrate dehydratase PrpD
MMASYGVVARGEPLTGEAGLFNAYYHREYDGAALTLDLGSQFRSTERCIKAMPGTLVSHAFAEAALNLMQEHKLAAQHIERVQLHVGPWGKVMCEPAEMRRHPPSASAAMNSIPFIVAKAIVNGRIGLDDFQDQGRSQPAALAMTSRIDHLVDRALAAPRGLEPGVVDFVLTDGRTLRQRVDAPQGHPARPISTEGVVTKFRTNAGYAKRSRSDAAVDRLVDRVMNLDDIDDIGLLFDAIEEQESKNEGVS